MALQVAEQMADFLMTGAVVNALNMPSLSAEEAARLKPYMKLAEQLGSFAGQLTESELQEHRDRIRGPCRRAQRQAADRDRARPRCWRRSSTRSTWSTRRCICQRARHPRQRDAQHRAGGLPDPDPRHGHHRARQRAQRRRHAVRRRPAAHRRRSRASRIEAELGAAHAVRAQQGQAGLHRQSRPHPGRGRRSTSRPSISAARARARTRSAWSRSTSRLGEARAWPRCAASPNVVQAAELHF